MSLTLIGDVKQTLYIFRNANPDILEKMDKLLGGIQEGQILKNYRSPSQLVWLSNYFSDSFDNLKIHHSEPHKDIGENVLDVKSFNTVIAESSYVSKEISRLRYEGADLEDIAILARTNRQLLDFEAGLIAEKIPYIIKYDSRSVLNQSAFKVIYSIYSLLFNPKDINALCEILIPIKGIGGKFIDNLRSKVLYMLRNNPQFSVFEDINPQTMGKMTKQFQSVYELFESILKPAKADFMKETTNFMSFNYALSDLFKTHIICEGEDKSDVGAIRFTINREMFHRAFSTFNKVYKIALRDFEFERENDLNRFAKIYEMLQLSQESYTEYRNQKKSSDNNKRAAVILSTIHGYKGKEANYVFGVCLRRYDEVDENSFEEKCVFYVLITRAKEKLYLTSSDLIRSFKGDLIPSKDNPFIREYLKGLYKVKKIISEGVNNG